MTPLLSVTKWQILSFLYTLLLQLGKWWGRKLVVVCKFPTFVISEVFKHVCLTQQGWLTLSATSSLLSYCQCCLLLFAWTLVVVIRAGTFLLPPNFANDDWQYLIYVTVLNHLDWISLCWNWLLAWWVMLFVQYPSSVTQQIRTAIRRPMWFYSCHKSHTCELGLS